MKLFDAIMEANGNPDLLLTREEWEDDVAISVEDALAEDWVVFEPAEEPEEE